MKDHALAGLVRSILTAKTEGEATTIAGNVGADYSELIWKLLKRITWKRTLSQNALLHTWFGEIIKHNGDRSVSEIKGECHRRWGLAIRLRNPQFEWVWKRSGAVLDYEQQCVLLASGVLNLSSGMTKKELTEYMDEISRHYSAEGCQLTHPDE